MTTTEKLEMYKEKNKFIKKLDLILTTPPPRGMTVEAVDYEVYQQDERFQEFIVITFQGGAICPIGVGGNSNLANLQEVAEYIARPDYILIPMYERVKETWTLVNLEEDN